LRYKLFILEVLNYRTSSASRNSKSTSFYVRIFNAFTIDNTLEKFINVTKIITFVIKMITLLKTGYWKVMQLFYKNKSAHYHLREISRLTKLHGPSVSAILNELEEKGILKSQRQGNLREYSIIRNKNTFLIYTIFDLERWNRLPTIRKQAIECYLDKLPEQPIFVILFGSTAKETYRSGSDVDILIITNKIISTEDAEKEANALTGIKVSSFQMNRDQFLKEIKLKEDSVVQSALNTGYPQINHISYYEKYYERI